jgi:hypothetical protein
LNNLINVKQQIDPKACYLPIVKLMMFEVYVQIAKGFLAFAFGGVFIEALLVRHFVKFLEKKINRPPLN